MGGLLDPVVANLRRRVEGIGDLSLGQQVEIAGRCRIVGQDTCAAVRLKLDPDFANVGARSSAAGRLEGARQMLDVVAVFVGEDICLGERATLGPEPAA